jgi:hypothetical protein
MLFAVSKLFAMTLFHNENLLWRNGDGTPFANAEARAVGTVSRSSEHGSEIA